MTEGDGTARRQRWLLGFLVALAAASAGGQPLQNAISGARAPIDLARDFTAARALAHGDRRYAIDAERRNAEAARDGAPTVPVHGGPYLPHPPTATVALLPLASLGFSMAALVWALGSLAALAWLARSLLAIGAGEQPVPVARTIALFLALLLWPPVLHNLEKGQWSIVLAALMTAGWRAFARGQPMRAGLWIGVAACLKVMPGAVVAFFVARKPRAAASALGTVALLVAATLPLVGLTAWTIFLGASRPNVQALETWYANTASLHGLVARLFIGGAYAQPLIAAPMFGRALQAALGAGLVAVATAATFRRRQAPPLGEGDRALFALWTTLAVLMNPLAWAHSVVLLALPFALLASARAPVGRALLAVALVLVSIPKETLYRLAGPPPTTALSALPLSVHALGALLVFAAAVYFSFGTDGGGRSLRSG